MRSCKTAHERTHSQHHRNGHILRSLTPRRQQRPAVKQSRTPALIRFRIARERARKRRLHSKMCSDLLPPLPSPARSRRTHGHAPTWSRPSPQHAPVPSATRSAAGGRGKGHKSAETHARRGARTFTHPPRAVRASRDLLPSPMKSAARARARVREGKCLLLSRYPALPASSPSPDTASCVVCGGVTHASHTMRWASSSLGECTRPPHAWCDVGAGRRQGLVLTKPYHGLIEVLL